MPPRTLSPDTISPSSDPSGALSSPVRAGLAALRPELYARALRLVRSRSHADDLVQEAMLRALRFEHQFRGGTNLRAWVGQVLHSVFVTRYRSRRREERAIERLAMEPEGLGTASVAPAEEALGSRVERALASLPASYREAVNLVDREERSYRDAAMLAGVPVGTIMSRLHRGRKLLATALGAPSGVGPKLAA